MEKTRIDLSRIGTRDALDLAVLVEEEACERYTELSQQMETHRNAEAGRFFRFMADNEAKHRAALAARRYLLFGSEPTAVHRAMIFDIEAPDYSEVRALDTERMALRVAMRAEEKAHDFFVAALEQVTDSEVRKLFTELRDEEVHHRELVEEQLSRLPPDPALTAEDYADEPVSID